MIAILDPALFLTRDPDSSLPLDGEEESALAALVDDVARICRDHRARIPAVGWYWNELQRELILPLQRRARAGSRLRQGLDRLRGHAGSVALLERPEQGETKLWGVKPLFRWDRLPPQWLKIMEQLLIGCAPHGKETVLITRLFEGRNLEIHAERRCTLREKTRWRLYVHVPEHPPCHIPCVRSLRNLAVPWTTRFDERLPDTGRFPFCPPPRWWRRDTQAFRAFESRPAWLDRFGSGWAQPATGGDNHWDVFIEEPRLLQRIWHKGKEGPINVVTWGTPEEGKTPGDIHHVPKDKRPHFRPDAGWTCPKASD